MKAIIVDDEPKAIDLLKKYLEHFNRIELMATFRNGLKAYEYISQHSVDIIFLDINMPHISGIALSKILPDNVKVIFTTAYSEFAVESYEIQAIDYLMKPISLERFTKSISRILHNNESTLESSSERRLIHIKSGFETYRIDADQILYLAKDGNYMTYHLDKQKLIARETIQESLEKLPSSFVQTHKSFIVNIEKVVSYDKIGLNVGNNKIPVSDSYKDNVFSLLE